MPAPTESDLLNTLRGVVDPELGADIVELGMVREVTHPTEGPLRLVASAESPKRRMNRGALPAHLLRLETLVDIASTLQLITDQFGDMGRKVAYDGPAHAMATVRPDDLHRAITNLVENAVRFGAEAVIRLRVSADQFTIDVEDDGPGISDALKQNMLEPFVRGDEARNMDEAAGFGLGLSITNAIVLAHGGTLSLHDRQPHGLVARMQLPVRQQSERSAA